MNAILSFILALSLSSLALPVLIRKAGTWRLMDAPDDRKVHIGLIPRVGGIAIALAVLLSAAMWVIGDAALVGILLGALVIACFGVLDDRNNLDYRLKFGGQILGAAVLLGFGIQLHDLPFIDNAYLPHALLSLLTLVFLLATTNAFNLLDGLDGLAAGCGGLSIAAIAALALLAGSGDGIILVASAVLGGLLGFLRYNTHPAVVYLGDAGSQFLGFVIGGLALLLIERSPSDLSPVLILPLLGLPVIDTAVVMFVRLREGRSPFSADRNHIHHRLLGLGLKHHQAVAAIYLVQAALVSSAILLRGQDDLWILLTYAGMVGVGFGAFAWLRTRRGRAGDGLADAPETGAFMLGPWSASARRYLLAYVKWSLVVYLLVGALTIDAVTPDVSLVAFCCAIVTASYLIWPSLTLPMVRLATYLAAIYVSYLLSKPVDHGWFGSWPFYVWLGSVALAIAFVTVSAPRNRFELSTQDLLAVLMILGITVLPVLGLDRTLIIATAIRGLVFIYACELVLTMATTQAKKIGVSAIVSLLTITLLYLVGPI